MDKTEIENLLAKDKIMERSIAKEVLGTKMCDYHANNPKKTSAIIRSFRYSLAEFNEENDIDDDYGNKLLEIANVVGEDMVMLCVNNPKFIDTIIDLDKQTAIELKRTVYFLEEIKRIYSEILCCNFNARITWLCKSFLGNKNEIQTEFVKQNIVFVKDIDKISPDSWSYEILNEFKQLGNFLRFDLILYVEESIADIVNCKDLSRMVCRERSKDVILSRSSGESLEKIGKRFGVTKERVRQIEITAEAPFKIEDNGNNFLYIFAAFAPKNGVVYMAQLIEGLGELTDVFVYLLNSNSDGKQFLHSPELNVLFVSNVV